MEIQFFNNMDNQVLSIEQMQELMELGVDTSKASMYWSYLDFYDSTLKPFWSLQLGSIEGDKENIPTFTLYDILSMLPKSIYLSANREARLTFDNRGLLEYVYIDYGELCATYHYAEHCTTLIDSAFDMLKWCKQNNYI